MAEVSPSRAVALAVVSRARRRDAYARELLRAAPEMARLSLKARGLASRLVLGSTACRGLLDAVLDSHLRRPRDLEPRVRDALRVACFEVMYLETSPEVSVFQGVELVRTVARRASGLANAVLRKVVSCDRPRVRSARERVTAALAGGVPVSVADVSLVAGMPSWLAVRLCASLPAPQAAAMALAQLDRPPRGSPPTPACATPPRPTRACARAARRRCPWRCPGRSCSRSPPPWPGAASWARWTWW